MPEDLKLAMVNHYYEGNGLFPQGLSNGYFQLCYIGTPDVKDNLSMMTGLIRQDTSSKTVEIDSLCGRVYLKIHYSEWQMIPNVLISLSMNGYNFCITSRWLEVTFDAGTIFSLQEYEKRLVCQLLDKFKTAVGEGTQHSFKENVLNFCEPDGFYECPLMQDYNFSTSYGKNFCKTMREFYNVDVKQLSTDCFMRNENYIQTCKKYRIYEFGTWDAYQPLDFNGKSIYEKEESVPQSSNCGCDPNSNSCPHKNLASTQSPAPSTQSSSIKKEDVCMVCLEAKPNTIIFPCEHQVVCFECSKELEGGPNKDLCVKCRQKIDCVFLISV